MVASVAIIFTVIVPLLSITFIRDEQTKSVWPMVHVIGIPLKRKYSTHLFTQLVVGSTATL